MNKREGRVLVTTDGSPRSRRALPFAASFAAAMGAGVTLAQVLNPKDDATPVKVEEELRAMLQRDGIEGEALTRTLQDGESVPDAILRLSQEIDASLIAMDTRGHSAVRHALQGSVALDVLGRTERPLLLTGANIADQPALDDTYRLVLTSDGSPASEAVARALAPLLAMGRFAVTLLRVHELEPEGKGEAEAEQECLAQLEGLKALLPDGVEAEAFVRTIPRMGGIDTAIIEEAQKRGANAIALSSHGSSAVRHVVAGSVAMLLLSRSPLPLIMERALD